MPEINKSDRMKSWFEADFQPAQNVAAEHRLANAADYSAYHLGQINKKLDRLIAAIEKLAASKG